MFYDISNIFNILQHMAFILQCSMCGVCIQVEFGCICFNFFYCFGFLNVFSRSLLERMNNHTCYISFPFLHCVFSNGSSEHFYKRMLSRTGCIYLCLLKCLFHVSSNCLPQSMRNHTDYICWTFSTCVVKCAFKKVV